LIAIPNSEGVGNLTISTPSTEEQTHDSNSNVVVRTRSGRISKPSNRLIED